MDVEDATMSEKCENVMNVVVESRKRFGKMCVDYEHKTSLMENKMLNLKLETISNYKIKPKNVLPTVDVAEINKDLDCFAAEIVERKIRIDNLKKKVRDTQSIVHQLKQDGVTKKVHQPLTAETMLMQAKEKLGVMQEKNNCEQV